MSLWVNHHCREIAIRVAHGLGGHHAGVHTIHGLHHLRRERCVSRNGSVRWSIAVTMALCVRSDARRDAKRESKTNLLPEVRYDQGTIFHDVQYDEGTN